jgi:hypothetical protein
MLHAVRLGEITIRHRQEIPGVLNIGNIGADRGLASAIAVLTPSVRENSSCDSSPIVGGLS